MHFNFLHNKKMENATTSHGGGIQVDKLEKPLSKEEEYEDENIQCLYEMIKDPGDVLEHRDLKNILKKKILSIDELKKSSRTQDELRKIINICEEEENNNFAGQIRDLPFYKDPLEKEQEAA